MKINISNDIADPCTNHNDIVINDSLIHSILFRASIIKIEIISEPCKLISAPILLNG